MRVSAASNQSECNAPSVSLGLGSTVGEITRSSALPVVRSIQTTTISATQPAAASAREVVLGVARRRMRAQ